MLLVVFLHIPFPQIHKLVIFCLCLCSPCVWNVIYNKKLNNEMKVFSSLKIPVLSYEGYNIYSTVPYIKYSTSAHTI